MDILASATKALSEFWGRLSSRHDARKMEAAKQAVSFHNSRKQYLEGIHQALLDYPKWMETRRESHMALTSLWVDMKNGIRPNNHEVEDFKARNREANDQVDRIVSEVSRLAISYGSLPSGIMGDAPLLKALERYFRKFLLPTTAIDYEEFNKLKSDLSLLTHFEYSCSREVLGESRTQNPKLQVIPNLLE